MELIRLDYPIERERERGISIESANYFYLAKSVARFFERINKVRSEWNIKDRGRANVTGNKQKLGFAPSDKSYNASNRLNPFPLPSSLRR